MTTEKYLEKLHSELLTIMDEIHKVCKDNNLTYFLAEGSLLGAVRHNGFIPWDDDLDIAMPRDDFEIFIKIAPLQLSKSFRLEWTTTNEKYWQFFAKVVKQNTMFDENSDIKLFTTGIFVDIFPLDITPEYDTTFEYRRKAVRLLKGFLSLRSRKPNCFVDVLLKPLSLILSPSTIQSLIRKILRQLSKKGASHYANFASCYSINKQTMPIEWFGKGKLVGFENRLYNIPHHPQEVLKSIYGDDYMIMPPLEKRKTHCPQKVVFSDGETIVF